MATRTMPFCLKMLTFGHPESSGGTPAIPDAGRAYGHSHSAFLLGNAYIWPLRGLPAHFGIPDAGRVHNHSHSAFLLGNAYIWPLRGLGGTSETHRRGGVTGHSHNAFLLGNAYIWPPRELRRTSGIGRRGEGDWPLSQCLFALEWSHLATQRARGHFGRPADSHSAFLLGNAYIWATQRAPAHS